MAKQAKSGSGIFATDAIFYDALRRCPGGSAGPAPFCGGTPGGTNWNCYIGCNFGGYGTSITTPNYKGITGPFYYSDSLPPMPASRIKRPAQAMIFTDTLTHYVHSPLLWPFTRDADGDGLKDSSAVDAGIAYNDARPTVERVSFRILWRTAGASDMTSRFWYIE